MKLEKGILMTTRAGRPQKKLDEAIKLFMLAEHGDSFFVPLEDTDNGKLTYNQCYYINTFNQNKNKIGKSTFKLKSRKVEGGIRFWFFDTNI